MFTQHLWKRKDRNKAAMQHFRLSVEDALHFMTLTPWRVAVFYPRTKKKIYPRTKAPYISLCLVLKKNGKRVYSLKPKMYVHQIQPSRKAFYSQHEAMAHKSQNRLSKYTQAQTIGEKLSHSTVACSVFGYYRKVCFLFFYIPAFTAFLYNSHAQISGNVGCFSGAFAASLYPLPPKVLLRLVLCACCCVLERSERCYET